MTVLELTAEEYHQDATGDTPTLSASIARILCAKTPAHAKAAHPRLNPDYERTHDEKFDIGTAAHSLLLQGVDLVHVCHYDDWRKAEAKEARDTARAHGRIPLLAKQWQDVERMLNAVRAQLAVLKIQPAPFSTGKPEQTLVWDEGGVACRARLDWITDDHAHVFDLKTTSRSAEPHSWARTLFNMGAQIQYSFYKRGCRAVFGIDPQFVWVVTETEAPYAISLVSLAPSAEALADEQVEYAIATWRRCIETGNWPAYQEQIAYAEAPGYEEARWLERTEVAA